MESAIFGRPAPLYLSARILLLGQVMYIIVTLLHADGDANNHPVAFAEYARDGIWLAVHTCQFASMAILLAGLIGLAGFLDQQPGTGRWACRLGAASAVVTLALYGVLQGVDGVALKQAAVAWAAASDTERAARFAGVETVRWIEWGVRSYQSFVMGLTLLLFAVALGSVQGLPRPAAFLAGLSGLIHLLQGWVVGSEGFSATESVFIVLAHPLNIAWMAWLAIVARRPSTPSSASDQRRSR